MLASFLYIMVVCLQLCTCSSTITSAMAYRRDLRYVLEEKKKCILFSGKSACHQGNAITHSQSFHCFYCFYCCAFMIIMYLAPHILIKIVLHCILVCLYTAYLKSLFLLHFMSVDQSNILITLQ